MIKITEVNDCWVLTDDKKNTNLYQIPNNRLTESSLFADSCPMWIVHLTNKSFIGEKNKGVLYKLANIIEKKRPNVFNWHETFGRVENSIYESIMLNHLSQKHKDELSDVDFMDMEEVWETMSDRRLKLVINEIVYENLSKYNLPFSVN